MAGEKQWAGTGFALKDKYVITNYHVVDGARTLKVRGINGDFTKIYNAVVVAKDATHDMAIIRIEDDKFNGFGDIPYTIKSGLSEVGEDIFVLGYPLMSTMGEEVKLTTGIISSRSGFQGDVSAYQISAPIQPGNSGGPLFDSNGDIVGIVNAKHGQADNAGYAIKSPYMRLFIQNSLNPSIIPLNRKMIGLSLVSKVKTTKSFIFIIYANMDSLENTQPATSNTIVKPQLPPYNTGQICKVGDIISINGIDGIVFDIDASGKHGKAISAKEMTCNWSEAKTWCASLKNGWYLPDVEELKSLFYRKNEIDQVLLQNGYTELGEYFWSREEKNHSLAWVVIMSNGAVYDNIKGNIYHARAVYTF